jgi:hypothetical protein
MNAVNVIAIWGLVAIAASIAAGIMAAAKNRDHSWWAAWCFVFPPMLIVLTLLGRNTGPRPPRRPLDDGEGERDLI